MLDMALVLFVVATMVGFYLLHTYRPSPPPTSPASLEPSPSIDGSKVHTHSNNTATNSNNNSIQRSKRGISENNKGLGMMLEALGFKGQVTEGDFQAFQDHFQSFEEVSEAIKASGLRAVKLVIGVDFSASNEWQGKKSFSRHCLHRLHPLRSACVYNPYQRVISILGKTLQPFTQAHAIHAYGFGDSKTQDFGVFPLKEDASACKDFRDVLQRYNEVVRKVTLSGPTSYAPVIRKALQHVKTQNQYHILVIIADGQVGRHDNQTVAAIVEASAYPMSIVMVGVGDGPWELMEDFDDDLPERRFDNFQFVNFHRALQGSNPETAFALQALMEIPDQYQVIRKMEYLEDNKQVYYQPKVD